MTSLKKLVMMLSIAVLVLSGCLGEVARETTPEIPKAITPPAVEIDPVEEEDGDEAAMSLEDKLWQLFYVTPEALNDGHEVTEVTERFFENAKTYKVGGIILFERNVRDRNQVMELLGDLSVCFETPVFLGVDEEGGRVTRLSGACGVTDNGNMSDIETASDARRVGERLGGELSGLGFNMDFAPVADVLIDPDNTEIGSRSFGFDPIDVAEKVGSEVRGMQRRGISSVMKHFPGHGSTSENSHEGTSVSERTLDQLRECELLPFIAGIEAGADFVMISHMSLPEVVGDNTPCSLSQAIITGLLREELGYSGIVITDAQNMGAVTIYGPDEAAVLAIEAGADMVLMPDDLDAAYEGLLSAVTSGRITESRIDESIERILSLKRRMGLIV